VVGNDSNHFFAGFCIWKATQASLAVAEEASAKIQNHDLNFTIQHSGITEIDEIAAFP
jgi:hypothetical protein